MRIKITTLKMAASSAETSLEKNEFTPNISTMPPRPEVTYNWINITSEFFHATKDLQLGELLHDDIFGLFEAMSAIEMMDPKMDAGMMCNRGKKVLNFDQAVKAGALKLNNLTMEELVGIMDSMLACLVTWLEGHSAAQTILTCLYLHKPLSIEDRALRAFSIQTLKLIAIINNVVHRSYQFQSLKPPSSSRGTTQAPPRPHLRRVSPATHLLGVSAYQWLRRGKRGIESTIETCCSLCWSIIPCVPLPVPSGVAGRWFNLEDSAWICVINIFIYITNSLSSATVFGRVYTFRCILVHCGVTAIYEVYTLWYVIVHCDDSANTPGSRAQSPGLRHSNGHVFDVSKSYYWLVSIYGWAFDALALYWCERNGCQGGSSPP
ncbi:hypothetical protein O3P69_007912 [Scylla paramamosain]|uniref:NAA35-like N-terminal domain-containing protein n=1 Tax=Scylla paramamosain TaxID=85552 RepID=A0AAW0T050_SCYPA